MYLENTETMMSFLKEIVFAGKFCQTPWCQARPPPCLNNGKIACIYYHGNIRACRYLSFREKKQLWTTIIKTCDGKRNFFSNLSRWYIIECHFFNGVRYLHCHCASHHQHKGGTEFFPKLLFKARVLLPQIFPQLCDNKCFGCCSWRRDQVKRWYCRTTGLSFFLIT